MASILRVTFDQLIQAVQDKLVSDGVVSSASQVKWVAGDEPPHLMGQTDILLVQGDDAANDPVRRGGGRYATWVEASLDVFVRTQNVSDPTGTNKDWLIQHNKTKSAVADSLDLYWPEDEDENLLTNCAMTFDRSLRPTRTKRDKSWGDSAGVLEIHYMPIRTLPGNT